MSGPWPAILPALEARRRRDEAALAAARAEEARLREALAAMEAEARTALTGAGLAPHAAGAAPLWQDLMRRRRAALLRDLAVAAARAGEAEARLRRSFGRAEAVAGLARRAVLKERRQDGRRQEAASIARLLLRRD